jgi:metal-responsive CopG/Arc/MetJ family transcriptional regulator
MSSDTRTMGFAADDKLRAEIEKQAKLEDSDASKLIRRAVNKYLDDARAERKRRKGA